MDVVEFSSGFYTEGYAQPIVTKTGIFESEVAASSAINRDPSSSPFQLGLLEPALANFYKSKLKDPDFAQLSVFRDLRRAIMRVLAERRGIALLPYAQDVLQSESKIITHYEREGWFNGDRTFRGDRERVHFGDEAVVAATLNRFFDESNQSLFEDLRTRGEYDIFAHEYTRLTNAVNNQARKIAELEGSANSELPHYPVNNDPRSGHQRLMVRLAK